jgi:restriction system protein
MAEFTIKRRGEVVREIFEVLLSAPDGLQAKDVLSRVAESLSLTEFEKSDYPSRPGVRRFEKMARFSSITVVKAGWLIKEKGRWSLTEEGKRAFHKFKDPEMFYREAWKLYSQWQAQQPEMATDAEEEDPSDAVSAVEEAEEVAWAGIEAYLRKMNPYDFQNLVAALLRAMGYHVAWVAPPGPDKGIDIVAYTDPLGTAVPRMKVQVKRRADKISVDGVRSFMAILSEHDVGIFVSLGGFTPDAESEARTQHNRRVTLLGLERLFDLWVEHYSKIDESDRKLLPLKPVHCLALIP